MLSFRPVGQKTTWTAFQSLKPKVQIDSSLLNIRISICHGFDFDPSSQLSKVDLRKMICGKSCNWQKGDKEAPFLLSMINELIKAALLLLLRSWSHQTGPDWKQKTIQATRSLKTTCSSLKIRPISIWLWIMLIAVQQCSDLDPVCSLPRPVLFVCFFCPLPLLPRNPIWRLEPELRRSLLRRPFWSLLALVGIAEQHGERWKAFLSSCVPSRILQRTLFEPPTLFLSRALHASSSSFHLRLAGWLANSRTFSTNQRLAGSHVTLPANENGPKCGTAEWAQGRGGTESRAVIGRLLLWVRLAWLLQRTLRAVWPDLILITE